MDSIVDYLKLCAAAGSKLDAFVVANGEAFKTGPDTYKGRRGRKGLCYMNATFKALANHRLIYCEGYALVCGVPIQHAWCIDPDGVVVDPTVTNDDGHVTDYFGVPFTTRYLRDAAVQNDVYGILGFMSKTYRDLVDGKVTNFRAATIGGRG